MRTGAFINVGLICIIPQKHTNEWKQNKLADIEIMYFKRSETVRHNLKLEDETIKKTFSSIPDLCWKQQGTIFKPHLSD